jgi:hypothetical protein
MAFALVRLFSFINYDLNPLKLTNSTEIEGYVLSLLQAIGRQDNKNNYRSKRMSKSSFDARDCYLLAMLNTHSQDCEVSDCICKELEIHSLNNTNASQVRRNWLLFVREQLGEFLKKYSNNPQLHIMAACFEYYWLGNIFTALEHLNRVYVLKHSIPSIATTLHIYRKIEKDIISGNFIAKNRGGDGTELAEVIRINTFLKLFNKFTRMIENCTADSIEFWSMLIKDAPDTALLNSIGNKIFECTKKLDELYYKILECDPDNLNFLCMYGTFLKYIVFDEITSSKILARVRTLKDNREVDKKLLRTSYRSKRNKVMLLKISGNQETFGKILDVNLEATLELKYTREEFKNININKLMPPFIASKHNEWVKRSFTNTSLDNMMTRIFVSDKDGYYFHVNGEVKLVPNLKEGISFILSMYPNRKLRNYLNQVGQSAEIKKSYCLLLCDGKEKVVGINDTAGKLFSIMPNAINPEITLKMLIVELDNKEAREAAKSNKGYKCSIDITHIERTLGDSDKIYDDSFEENSTKLSVWMRLIEDVYGEQYNLPCKQVVLVLYPISKHATGYIRSLELKAQATGEIWDESDDNVDEKQLGNFTDSLSVSIGSSQASNKNLAREIKASLRDRNTPFSVKVFIYTIWIIYAMLLAVCIIDWVVSYIKAYEADDLFKAIDYIMNRLNSLIIATQDARTLDLIVRGLEDNQYYGDEFFTKINMHVI